VVAGIGGAYGWRAWSVGRARRRTRWQMYSRAVAGGPRWQVGIERVRGDGQVVEAKPSRSWWGADPLERDRLHAEAQAQFDAYQLNQPKWVTR